MRDRAASPASAGDRPRRRGRAAPSFAGRWRFRAVAVGRAGVAGSTPGRGRRYGRGRPPPGPRASGRRLPGRPVRRSDPPGTVGGAHARPAGHAQTDGSRTGPPAFTVAVRPGPVARAYVLETARASNLTRSRLVRLSSLARTRLRAGARGREARTGPTSAPGRSHSEGAPGAGSPGTGSRVYRQRVGSTAKRKRASRPAQPLLEPSSCSRSPPGRRTEPPTPSSRAPSSPSVASRTVGAQIISMSLLTRRAFFEFRRNRPFLYRPYAVLPA